MTAVPTNHASARELSAFLDQFAGDSAGGLVIEVRALRMPTPDRGLATLFGFFDVGSARSRQAMEESIALLLSLDPQQQPEGVYLTMNPLRPDIRARAPDCLREAKVGECAKDCDVIARRWLVVDVDRKPTGRQSATDKEKRAVWDVTDNIRADLDGRGWPKPVLVDSGNGFHLWYPIEGVPRDSCVEKVLKGLAKKHDSATAELDTSMYNPSRIAKLPGTWARKGQHTSERPHRMARVLEVPPV